VTEHCKRTRFVLFGVIIYRLLRFYSRVGCVSRLACGMYHREAYCHFIAFRASLEGYTVEHCFIRPIASVEPI
jgi:hypothetical protein